MASNGNLKTPRPSILFLVHRAPYPPNKGDRIRSFHNLKWLSRRADVHLACLNEETPGEETLRELDERCRRVAVVPTGAKTRWLRAAWSVALGRTATEGLFRALPLKRIVRAWAQSTRFHAALVFCSSMAQYVDVAGLEGVPVVVDLVDVDSQKWLDYAATSRGLKRWLFRLEGRRLRRLELRLAERARAVTLVSEAEVEVYRGFCGRGRVMALDNGVDLDYFRPASPPRSEASRGCVFVGALDYRANLDGLAWFFQAVWPEVHRRLPDATFTVVGSNPTAAARRLAELPGVTLAGQVPDVRPYLNEAALVVVPLRVARGVQNKILEALSAGKAVLASPQALEGLEAEPGVHLGLASSPEEWADSAVRLLTDPALRDKLGRAGRAYVERRHSWSACLEPLAGLLDLAPQP